MRVVLLFLFLFQCLSFAHVFPVSQNNGLIRPNLRLSNLQRLCANSELVLPFGAPPEAFMCLHFELCHVVGLCSVASNKIVFVMCKKRKRKKHLQVTVMKTASKLAVLTVLVLLLVEAHISVAVTCSAIQLSPCLGAITSNSAPSTLCCSRIREQKPCLCTYLKNPTLRNYVNSPGAKKVARTCGVPYPKC